MQSVQLKTKRQGSYDILMPACEISRVFARLSGSENINKPTRAAMEQLGYVINVQQEQRAV